LKRPREIALEPFQSISHSLAVGKRGHASNSGNRTVNLQKRPSGRELPL
jgi:hypothetical protein